MIIAWIIAETAGVVDVVFGFFSRGGLFMWPLLICSIVSVTILILRGFGFGACFLAPRFELRRWRIGHAPDRAWHRRSIKRNRLRTFHRCADTGRVHLFFPKSRSDVRGDGNARSRVDQQMLLRPRYA